MKTVTRLLTAALLLIAGTAAAGAAPIGAAMDASPQASVERARGHFDRAQLSAAMLELHARLIAEQVTAGLSRPLEVPAPAAALRAVAENPEPRLRVGVAVAAGAPVRFRGVRPGEIDGGSARSLAFGAITGDGADGFVWTGAVHSEGAAALRLRLEDLFLPRNAELYVYNLAGEAFGPYTGRGRTEVLWTHTVAGPTLLLQVRYTGADTARALAATRFTVAEVGHLTPEFPAALLVDPTASRPALSTRAFCSFNAACVENAECSSIPPAIEAARDAYAQILFASGGFLFICSGGLIADTDPGSQIPYFLTANHCLSKRKEAESVEAFFQFTTPCGGPCYDPAGAVPRTLGSSIAATDRTSDYTLLQLDEPAPAGSAFLGWNSTPVAFADGTDLFRISHPAGAPQAYSEHRVDTDKPTCTGWPRGDWIYSHDLFGATEGGSSGSPVLNGSGQVVGQLSGACGFNVNDPCDSAENATVDGAFAAYFDDVAGILDPGTGCTDADGDGWCVEEGDCDDGDPAVNPGAAEVCDDGLDNDCDGLIDGDDGDCSGGCDLLPPGASCTDDSECCSGKCRGRPGNQTCR